ncbi:dihydrolipoamide acetyltransferase family protein [Sinomonas mesophila]|uniref:dihydrolipoamide acetyltransferase family protein n=1 Tax=Sinomonas mesophila TaxID=1531955 RepID=UPI001FE80DC1|nr:dihydrolipoamide acetyltransferase family protein [Sinomonas mesophila]
MSETVHAGTPGAPATVIREFRLPDLGEGLTESEIVAWHVAAGDRVTLNQVIAEVETAKAVVEVPSPYTGTVVELLAEPGTTVAVGTPIVSFEVPADAVRPPSRAGSAGGGAPAPRREPNLVGYGAVVEGTGRPARRSRAWAAPAPEAERGEGEPTTEPAAVEPAVEPSEAAPVVERGEAESRPRPERPRSTPPVRKLAKDLGVDLVGLTGTGPGGLITRDDVLAALGAGAGRTEAEGERAAEAGPAVVRAAGERETRTPIKGVRKHTAAAMVASAFTAPQASEFLTVDVTPSMDLLARLRESRAFAHLKLTPLTLVAKAVLIGLARNPTLNSHWDEGAQEIVQYHYVNLGIAAATPRGLVVPNVKDADAMTLAELAEAIADLAATARDGHTRPADLSGGTISITNIGVFGIDAGTPILHPGEAAIIAVGQVRRLPWEFEGQVALRQVMTISLTFDHRLVDGEQASRFLADVGAILADPGMVLTMV